MPLRTWAGQDISCLNLTRAQYADDPRGAPRDGRARRIHDAKENLLARLEQPIENNEVPVMTDTETATYILKLGVGDTMPITDQRGVPRKLKLVGTLDHSIFQSEMLMGEANFRRAVPVAERVWDGPGGGGRRRRGGGPPAPAEQSRATTRSRWTGRPSGWPSTRR